MSNLLTRPCVLLTPSQHKEHLSVLGRAAGWCWAACIS